MRTPIEVARNLFVAPEPWEVDVTTWPAVLGCAKDPYHRQAVGYTGRALKADHPEYLFAYRGLRYYGVGTQLYLNMVDDLPVHLYREEMVNEGLLHLAAMTPWLRTVVVCNQGCSRSAAMALMFMAHERLLPKGTLEKAEEAFRDIYPLYDPSAGVRGYMAEHWEELLSGARWTSMKLARYRVPRD